MKIRVVLEIDVDPTEWSRTGRTGTSQAEVRRDVKEYILYNTQGAPMIDEAEATVTLK